MNERPTQRRAVALMALLAALAAAGGAAAEGLEPIQYTFGDGTVIRFSGQINMGVLNYDDGQEDNTDFVDNENSSSRARLQVFSTSGDWKFESTFEAEYQPLASNEVSQLNDTPNWDFRQRNIRKAEVAFANDRFGKLWLGQGSMASDGTAEVDKSGTDVVAYSLISDTAGGYFFRFAGDDLSDIQVGDAFTNYDGMGRKFRARYDTPAHHGFGLRSSVGVDWLVDDPQPIYDIAATYNGDFDNLAIAGAVSLSRNEASDVTILTGSVSGLHKPTGLSLTVAAGQEESDDPTAYYGYVKLGYQREFFSIGSTAFSVDYYYGDGIATAGSQSNSIGLAAVQKIDEYNLDLWLLWRNHSYDDPAADYDDGQAFFGGAIFRF